MACATAEPRTGKGEKGGLEGDEHHRLNIGASTVLPDLGEEQGLEGENLGTGFPTRRTSEQGLRPREPRSRFSDQPRKKDSYMINVKDFFRISLKKVFWKKTKISVFLRGLSFSGYGSVGLPVRQGSVLVSGFPGK